MTKIKKISVGDLVRTPGTKDTYAVTYIDHKARLILLTRVTASQAYLSFNCLKKTLANEQGEVGMRLAQVLENLIHSTLPENWDQVQEGSIMLSFESFIASGFRRVDSLDAVLNTFIDNGD